MTNDRTINFASDNAAPVAPEIMDALSQENSGPAMGYGNDDTTRRMEEKFKELFECDLKAYPVATGTAANALSLSVLTPPYGSIYCHVESHIQNDECGSPEFYTSGAKLCLLPGENGKLSPDLLRSRLDQAGAGIVHHVQPAALSLTQVTECGTIYTPSEIAALSEVARSFDLKTHMDGARFANAVEALDIAPADITWKAGIDVLSFGGTKNGAMAVEAVLFFDMEKAQEFEFRRKRGAHLFSKSRYLSAQLDRYVEDDLWLKLAQSANGMAKRLAFGLAEQEGCALIYPVEANMIFARLPEATLQALKSENILFYVMGSEEEPRVRLVTSWDTTEEDVDHFLEIVRNSA